MPVPAKVGTRPGEPPRATWPPDRPSGATGVRPVTEPDLVVREEPFATGARVAIVEVMGGKVWTVRPVTVLRDAPDEIALWLAGGTVTRYPTGPQHGEHTVRQWLTGDWDLVDVEWSAPGTLRLSRPGDAFDVWRLPGCWYVNLQDPLTRVAAGFRTIDHILDVVVAPDLGSWRWKDEDELAHAQAAGLFSPERVAAIRATGEAVIAAVEAGTPPWDPTWESRLPADPDPDA